MVSCVWFGLANRSIRLESVFGVVFEEFESGGDGMLAFPHFRHGFAVSFGDDDEFVVFE